ncbi:MAG: helix-turn-helix transcriptional regulator [Magnetococcales bacterium]|nr:helix-turn-helix transcriptional regulator [Magnetococcales bacterium]
MTIGARIRRLRLEQGLTQKGLALQAGVSQQLINKLESGKGESTKHIIKIAAALQVSSEWLAVGEASLSVFALEAASVEDRLDALWERVQRLEAAQKERLVLVLERLLDDQEHAGSLSKELKALSLRLAKLEQKQS